MYQRKITPLSQFYNAYKTPLQVSLLLLLYIFIFTLKAGKIGFYGDTWQIIDLSYHKNLFQAIDAITRDFRPIEAGFWIIEFWLIGLNSQVSQFISLSLQLLSVTVLGLVMYRITQKNALATVFGMLFVYFHPALSQLTFLVHTDNLRLSSIFFWLSVFVALAKKPNFQWLSLSHLLWLLSIFTYESFAFAGLILPFIWVVSKNYSREQWRSSLKYIYLVFTLPSFSVYVLFRFLFLHGGAVKSAAFSLYTILINFIRYYYVAFEFLYEPIKSVLFVHPILSTVIGLSGLVFFFKLPYQTSTKVAPRQLRYLLGIIFALTILTAVPYVLTNYAVKVSWLSGSRVFSGFIDSLGIFLAICIAHIAKQPPVRIMVILVMCLYVSLSIWKFDRIYPWKQAFQTQRNYLFSLAQTMPQLKNGTNLILFDAQQYINKAIVFESIPGINHLIKIMYGNPTIYTNFGYTTDGPFPVTKEKLIKTSCCDIQIPGMIYPYPYTSTVVIRFQNYQTHVIQSITPQDSEYYIQWDKPSRKIITNEGLIIPGHINPEFANQYLATPMAPLPAVQ